MWLERGLKREHGWMDRLRVPKTGPSQWLDHLGNKVSKNDIVWLNWLGSIHWWCGANLFYAWRSVFVDTEEAWRLNLKLSMVQYHVCDSWRQFHLWNIQRLDGSIGFCSLVQCRICYFDKGARNCEIGGSQGSMMVVHSAINSDVCVGRVLSTPLYISSRKIQDSSICWWKNTDLSYCLRKPCENNRSHGIGPFHGMTLC
jgi:hypothetical protein